VTPQAQPQLVLEQVSVTMPPTGRYLLEGISFTITAGESVGIIGPAGAGKTSLLRLLNRLHDPSQGQIFWHGQDLRTYPIQSLRRQIMLVPQEPRLLGMTVREALTYPLRLQKLPTTEITHRLQGCQAQMQIPTDWLDRQEAQLSVGQRHWVCLGRALLAEPSVLLLDEPTAALDGGRLEQLVEVLLCWPQALKMLIIATHQFELLQRLCQRLIWLEQGSLHQDIHPARTQGLDWSDIRREFQAQRQASQVEWDVG
jgi:D-methionine transport system ATP-binding protein